MFTACSDKKNKETIDYYLSQPKDPELLGWWKHDIETGSVFWHFREAGIISTLTDSEGNFYYSEYQYYWYIKEENDRKILYLFRPVGGLYASEYIRGYYEIKNDSLWVSSGIEGDQFYNSELSPFIARTTAPEGYEQVK